MIPYSRSQSTTMHADDSESQMSRNLEAPDCMKAFEEVLNQVKNLVAPVDFYQCTSNIAVVSHYLTRLSYCEAGRAGDEKQWVHPTSDAYGNKTAFCLSTPSAYVANYNRDGTSEVADYFKELHSYLAPRFCNEECVICCEVLGFNQVMWRLPCAHEVHYHCGFRWMKDGTSEVADYFKELHSYLAPRFCNEECVICCEVLGFNQVMWRLPCAHEVHYHCGFRWMKESRTHSCPFCRTVVAMNISGFRCKEGVFVIRSPPIMPSILNYISHADLRRWKVAYLEHFKRKGK